MNDLQVSNVCISIISDIVLEPHFNPLINAHFCKNIKVYTIPYGEQNQDEYKKQIKLSNIVIVWLNFEASYLNPCKTLYFQSSTDHNIIESIVASCKKLYTEISKCTNTCILWFLFEDYFHKLSIITGYKYNALVDKINEELSEALKNEVSFIDLKHIIANVGVDNAYDTINKYRWNSPYSKVLIETAVKEIHKQYFIERGITKKCLVIDCDNVLWGGILSEDGIKNIQLSRNGFGKPYYDFQTFVLSLYYHGVILAVCSKNDLSDVMTMFREHSEMILKEEHIACFQVNWDNKPENIKKIARTLNIGLDSIVFIDDSKIEVEAVKSMLPEVTARLYERDSIYEQLSCFNLKNNTSIADIEKRIETYRTDQSRDALKAQYENYNEYITALDIKIELHEALPIEYNRISELTQRTNKCTNGKRYTVAGIIERLSDPNVKLYSVFVSDRFSDVGLVGVIEIESNTIITLFCLSCRSLGRNVEEIMIEYVKEHFHIKHIHCKNTEKNHDFLILLKTKLFISEINDWDY